MFSISKTIFIFYPISKIFGVAKKWRGFFLVVFYVSYPITIKLSSFHIFSRIFPLGLLWWSTRKGIFNMKIYKPLVTILCRWMFVLKQLNLNHHDYQIMKWKRTGHKWPKDESSSWWFYVKYIQKKKHKLEKMNEPWKSVINKNFILTL